MASVKQAGDEKTFVRAMEPFDVEKSKEEAATGGELLDWLGRPATKKHGGLKTTVFILANQGLWNIANFAVATNLVIYFMMVLQMSNATAANSVTNWFGTMWLTTLLGGFLGDSYLGRLWTCAVFQVVHIVVRRVALLGFLLVFFTSLCLSNSSAPLSLTDSKHS